MKPQLQLRQAADGDCLRACIATLLEVKIDSIPDFTAGDEAFKINAEKGYPNWWFDLQSWLKKRGLFLLEMRLVEGMPWMPLPFPALAIFHGMTKQGNRHALVGRLEDEKFLPVFNPMPEAGFLEHIDAISLLIPVDPSYYVKFGVTLERIRYTLNRGVVMKTALIESVIGMCNEALHDPQETINIIPVKLDGAPGN